MTFVWQLSINRYWTSILKMQALIDVSFACSYLLFVNRIEKVYLSFLNTFIL
jgi:hypothetical protein